MKTPILETKRLVLHPMSLGFARAYQKHFNNWNIIKTLGGTVPWPYPDNGAEDFIKNSVLPRMEKGEAHLWGLTLKDSSEFVGVIEFRMHPNTDGHRGFWLAEHMWGQGLMTEAVSATNDFIFDVLKYDEFIEMNNISNPASRALKRGGTRIETVEKSGPDGSVHISEVWHITREGWHAVRD